MGYHEVTLDRIATRAKLAASKRMQKKFDSFLENDNNFVNFAVKGYIDRGAIDIITYDLRIHEALKNLKPYIAETLNLLLKDLSDTYVYEGLIISKIEQIESNLNVKLEDNEVDYIHCYYLNKVSEMLEPLITEIVKKKQGGIVK